MTDEEKYKKKQELIDYDNSLSIWFENRMEKDKQILLLSSLAIGMLVVGLRGDARGCILLPLWVLANLSYLGAILCVLYIYAKNADYLAARIEKKEKEKEFYQGRLEKVTKMAVWLFVAGIFLTIGFVIVSLVLYS